MMPQQPQWRMIGASVRGAAHHRTGLPNQDALCCLPTDRAGPPLILAVSDGHGSAKSFRSDRGSRFAVDAVSTLLQELLDGPSVTSNLSAVKRLAEERLPQELIRRWRTAVDADLAADPFDETALADLHDQRGDRGVQEVSARPHLAYGATVLGALVTRDFLLFLQLGDGDILMVSDTGEVSRPFTRDRRLFANETTSLCMDDAWKEVRLGFHVQYGSAPALILVATDGYANSFVNDSAFLRVGSDILDILRRDGVQVVEESLHDWLREASDAGSGDDITLGILYRQDALDVAPEVDADSAQTVTPESAELDTSSGVSDDTVAAPSGVSVDQGTDAEQGRGSDAPEPEKEDDAPELRSRAVAKLKHQGPHEPSKQVRLKDLVDGDGNEAPSDA